MMSSLGILQQMVFICFPTMNIELFEGLLMILMDQINLLNIIGYKFSWPEQLLFFQVDIVVQQLTKPS